MEWEWSSHKGRKLDANGCTHDEDGGRSKCCKIPDQKLVEAIAQADEGCASTTMRGVRSSLG